MTTAPTNKPIIPDRFIAPIAPINIIAIGASTPLTNRMGFNTSLNTKIEICIQINKKVFL